LAVALRDRGHEVSFTAPSNCLAWIRATGFEADSNGTDVGATLQAAGADMQSMRWARGEEGSPRKGDPRTR